MKACSNSWKLSISRLRGRSVMSYIASPATRSYASDKGVDLEALAAATGRETLAREDVDRHLAGGATAAPSGADHSRYWAVDHSQYGPVTEEPLTRGLRQSGGGQCHDPAGHASRPRRHAPDRGVPQGIESRRTGEGRQADGAGLSGQGAGPLSGRVPSLQRLAGRERRNPDPEAVLPYRHCRGYAARSDGAGVA